MSRIQAKDESAGSPSDPGGAGLPWTSAGGSGTGSAMLVRERIERAVDLQARGYQLLRWLEKAFADGVIAPEAAHRFASMEDSACAWVERHYRELPAAARPAPEDLRAFGRLFSTYLTNTFDLDAQPGERLFSPDAHCFCPMCSWMVRVPHLRPKKLGTADKKVAERMKRSFVRALAAEIGAPASDEDVERVLRDPGLREAVGLVTYAADLLQRLEGVAVGPASLALWRSFAWTPEGSPRKGFTLSADAIMAALRTLRDHLEQRSDLLRR